MNEYYLSDEAETYEVEITNVRETARQTIRGWTATISFDLNGKAHKVTGFDQTYSIAKRNAWNAAHDVAERYAADVEDGYEEVGLAIPEDL